MKKLRRLPDTELEVLQALWDAGTPQPRAWIEGRLSGKGWASNTFNTYLTRLAEKGFVSCQRRGKTNYYTPLVSREAYLDFESRAVLGKLFGGSARSLMASLVRGGALSRADLDELQRCLDELRAQEEDRP